MTGTLESREDRREKLYARLVEEYRDRFQVSAAFHERASSRLVDGGSHALRMFAPFPCWVRSCRGAHIQDLDGHTILDFWQGHFANILGHNPPLITESLGQALSQGHGLHCGMQDVLEWELADLLCQCVGAEAVRFTTSGTLATMYAVLLARGFTSRSLVVKAGGGWHGAQPWGLKGVHFGTQGFQEAETEGLPAVALDEVLVTRYNDVEALEDVFRQHGPRIACFVVEPWLGAGGALAALPEFLRRARELADQYGALLVLDEVISGFRFRAGDLGSLYGVRPDLAAFGKVIGGGMPIAAVAGRADIMRLCGSAGRRRVRFDGGTYSAHPLAMLAGRTMLQYLKAEERAIYPRLGTMGTQLREGLERAFAREGVPARCTGDLRIGHGSSVLFLHFPYRVDTLADSPEAVNDPLLYDVALQQRVAKLAFLLEGVFVAHGCGAISLAHTGRDLERTALAAAAVARRLRDAGLAGAP